MSLNLTAADNAELDQIFAESRADELAAIEKERMFKASQGQTGGDYSSNDTQSIPKNKRGEKRFLANPDQKDLAEVARATMSEAVMKHPIPADPSPIPADYYRRGGPFRPVLSTVQTDQLELSFQEGALYQDPLPRQIGEQEEENIASIRLYGRKKRNPTAPKVDLIPPYTKFFLEAVQEGHSERSQIVETFGDFFVFFHGERPAVYNFSGMLINSGTVNWAEDFYFYYDNFLRGTKCVEAAAVLLITYGYRQIEGFILSFNMNINAISDKGIPVSFQVVVTDRKSLKLSPDFGIMEVGNNKFINDSSLIQMMKSGTSEGVVSDAYNYAKSVAEKKKAADTTSKPKASMQGVLINTYDIPPGGGSIITNPDTGGVMLS